eukprot:3496834-Rhodomonas_salina.2
MSPSTSHALHLALSPNLPPACPLSVPRRTQYGVGPSGGAYLPTLHMGGCAMLHGPTNAWYTPGTTASVQVRGQDTPARYVSGYKDTRCTR